MRQILLQVRISRADDNEIRKALLDFRGELDLAGTADEGVLGGLVAVGGGKQGRALNVRVVVGAAGRDVHHTDAEVAQQAEKLLGFLELITQRLPPVGAEGVFVGARAEVFRDSRSKRCSFAFARVGAERNEIERTEANRDFQRGRGANARYDFAQKAGYDFRTILRKVPGASRRSGIRAPDSHGSA